MCDGDDLDRGENSNNEVTGDKKDCVWIVSETMMVISEDIDCHSWLYAEFFFWGGDVLDF